MSPPVQGARPQTAPAESARLFLRVLRAQMRARRLALTDDQRTRAAQALVEPLTALFATLTSIRPARRIAAYWPVQAELDPLLALQHLGVVPVYLPVLTEDPAVPLRFAAHVPGEPLRLNCFRIPEPARPDAGSCAPEALDVVLLPLVAFDLQGNRLGMGGGYYDRSFAFCRDPARGTDRPQLVGIGYAFQQAEALSPAPWDVPLDAIATDVALHVCPHPLLPPPT